MVVGLVFASCDPLEEIYDEIDANAKPVVGETEYTLTDDDYDELELNYGSFSSEEDAKTDIPPLLSNMYPVWGKGSSVLVDYNLYVGSAFSIKDYNLTQDDYTFSGSDLLGFQSDADPLEYLPTILADNVSYAKEGDYRVAKYFQYTGDAYTVTPTVSLDDNFDYGDVAGNLTDITTEWAGHSGSAPYVGYATSGLSMADYPSSDIGGSVTIANPGGEDVNREFTPITSGKVYASALVNFSAVVSKGDYFFHFKDDSQYGNFRARVGAKDDGSGKILFGIGASSSTLTYGETPFELNTTYLIVTSYDLSTGASNLYVLTTAEATEPSTPEATNIGNDNPYVLAIGIRQDSSDGPTGTIDGVRAANTWSSIMSNDVLPDEVIGTKVADEMDYTYADGVWEAPSDEYYKLTEEDFESIGISSFGSSTQPDDYLPTFLNLKFPYAQEDDELDVAYLYVSSSSGAQTRGNLYTFIEGTWVGYQTTISTSLQFGHDGIAWIPDNTIKYTLTKADYCYLADQLKGEPGYDDALLDDLCFYGNFTYKWEDDQILYSLGILADYLSPNAEVGQKYVFTYVMYDNGTNDESIKIILEGGEWVLFE